MNESGPDDARYEIKFAAHDVFGAALRHWFHTHPAGFYSPFSPRWVNSAYFDSYCYTTFHDNLIGVSRRTKVRYRWYGKHDRPQPGVLEIKCKRNHVGWKHRFPVDTPPTEFGPRWSDIRKCLRTRAGPSARRWIEAHPHPVVIIRYYRRYLLSGDRRVRATIDTHRAVYDQRYKARPNFGLPANIPRTAVVEFKFDRNDRRLAESMIQGFPLRVSRNSKYIIATRAIQGY